MGAQLLEAFRARFAGAAAATPQVFEAPGRVNLIGEHTDYNDGFVLPMAVEFSTRVAAGRRDDRKLVVHSENFGETTELDLDYSSPHRRGHWSDYVLGVAVMLEREGFPLSGANLLIASDVPAGAGLSSSAALEVSAALALAPAPIERTRLAQLCQRAEHEFAGVKCGIMDQFIACHARAGSALLLDCRSLEYRHVPIPQGAKIVIANSMVHHSLAAGEYNRRREECRRAAALLGASLRDVPPEELERKRDVFTSSVLFRRARHVVTENARVLEACAAFERGDLAGFGKLMYESHRSLRDDYEVSCAELDALVDIARGVDGVYGSRMTGGGFGGCTVSLAAESRVDALLSAFKAGYPQGEFYVSDAAGAAGAVQVI